MKIGVKNTNFSVRNRKIAVLDTNVLVNHREIAPKNSKNGVQKSNLHAQDTILTGRQTLGLSRQLN